MATIQWLEWNKESFEKAKAERKPILLDIKGSWCHWCHVMDKTSYSDPSIIDALNKKFVPIRVDTDKRPDVNRRYNMGGWPTTAFLDSEGKIITGGTYIPPEQLREIIRSVLDMYARSKGKVGSKLETPRIPRPTSEKMSERITKDIATIVATSFDIDYGGFGFEPKFPQTEALEYALARYKYHGEKEMLTIVNRTLEKMGKGGMYDHVQNGFFRYSTTRDWTIPHFEKMAEDNARLLSIYLKAYQVTGTQYFKEKAEGILRYVQASLSDDAGCFYGSQDADELYYKLGLSDREKRAAPSIDKTFYTNYNALFVSAYLLGGEVLRKKEFTKFAIKTLDQLLESQDETGALPHFKSEDHSSPKGLLADHSLTVHALLDAYEYTGDAKYITSATKLAAVTIKTLADERDGGFYDIQLKSAEIGELRTREKPLDENSLMSMALLRLFWITGESNYEQLAERTLKLFADDYERYGIMAASYAMALELLLSGPVGITILGGNKSKQAEELRESARHFYPFRRYILQLDPSKDSERIRQLGYDASSAPAAFVCVGKVCGPPLKDPSLIESTITSLTNPQQIAASNP